MPSPMEVISIEQVVRNPPSFSFPVVEWKCAFDAEEIDSYAANADKYYKQLMLLQKHSSLWNQYTYMPPRHYPTNFVCTFNIDLNLGEQVNNSVKIDFRALTGQVAEAGFNPQNFAAAIWRCRCESMGKYKPVKGTVLMFTSGRMVCTGTESEVEGQVVAEYATMMLRERSKMPRLAKASVRDFTTQNVAASAYAGFFVALRELSNEWSFNRGASVNYEPTLFPGLIFRLPIPKLYEWQSSCIELPDIVAGAKTEAEARFLISKWEARKLVFLVFRSGSVVITGAKWEEETAAGWSWFHKNVLLNFRDSECTISRSSEYRHATAPLDRYTENVVQNVVELVNMLSEDSERLDGIGGFEDFSQIVADVGDIPDSAPSSVLRSIGRYGY